MSRRFFRGGTMLSLSRQDTDRRPVYEPAVDLEVEEEAAETFPIGV